MNGVQEAEGSNPFTQTSKTRLSVRIERVFALSENHRKIVENG